MFGGTSGFGGFGQPQQPNQQQQQQQQQQPQQGSGLFGGGGSTFGSSFGQPQQQAAGGFGQQPAATPGFGGGFGSTTSTTPAFGQQASTSAFGAQPSGGLFGAPATPAANTGFSFGAGGGTSAFGAPTTSAAPSSGGLFGAPKPATTTFGGFGASTQQQQQPVQAGGLFGGAAGGFGQPAQVAPGTGTASVQYQPTTVMEPPKEEGKPDPPNQTPHQFQSICCMPQYANYSFEELRLQDYQANRKTPTASTSAPAFGGGFGQASTTPGFGAAQPAAGGLFGSSNPGFGAGQPTTNTFGQQPQQQQTGGLFGSTTTGAFGQPAQQQQQGGGLFGAATSQPAQTGGLFGSAGTSGTTGGLFGQPQQQQQQQTPAFGGFGQTPAKPAGTGFSFGSTQPAASTASTGGLFGQTQPQQQQQTGGLFGQPQQQQQQPATGGLFGQPAQTSAAPGTFSFGGTSSATAAKPLFGGGAAASSAPAFGASTAATAPKPAFSFGASTTTPTAGGGLFGAQQQQQQQQPGTTGFGAAPSTGGGLFGSAGGTFGQPQQQQQQSATSAFGAGGLFGAAKPAAPTLGGGLFGGAQSTGQSLFGSQQQQQPQQQQRSSLFGSSTLGASSAFGQSTVAQQPQQPTAYATAGDANAYGANPLFQTTTSRASAPVEEKKKPPIFTSFRGTPVNRSATKITRLRGFGGSGSVSSPGGVASPLSFGSSFGANGSPAVGTPGSPAGGRSSPLRLVNGIGDDAALSPNAFVTRQSFKKLVIAPKHLNDAANRNGSPAPGASDETSKGSAPPRQKVTFDPSAEASSRERGNLFDSTSTIANDSTFAGAEATPIKKNGGNGGSLAADDSTAQASTTPAGWPPRRPTSAAAMPTKHGEYYTIPALDALKKLPAASLRAVPDLVVGRVGFGRVAFKKPVDLTTLPSLDDLLGGIVVFEDRNCSVYPNDYEDGKPEVGQGLNVPATIALERCWPLDKATRAPIKDPKHPRLVQHIKRLRGLEGTRYIDFSPEDGVWTFAIEEF